MSAVNNQHHREGNESTPDASVDSRSALNKFLQANIEPLQGIIRSYVVRTGLTYGEDVQTVTTDVFNETVVEVLSHAALFATIQQPRAWFLGIAANVIKRKRASKARRGQREFMATTVISESDFFDQVSNLIHPGPEHEVEARSQVEELLSLVTAEDQRILRLAFLQDLDTQSLALALRISTGTARVRLHRALQRARNAWQQKQERERVRNDRA